MDQLPFIIQKDSKGEPLKPINVRTGIYNETWLQNMIEKYPDILPVNEIEPVYYPLVSIGKEVFTENGGSIDNLFISTSGYLVLIETKLWRNPEAKRQVITQAIDYGSLLSSWSYERLDNIVKKYSNHIEGHEVELASWVIQKSKLEEINPIQFEKTVSNNLRFGRFLIVIVGDKIRESLIDLVGYVNKYPTLALNVAMVELSCYHLNKNKEWPLLVVPTIAAQTKIVERTIIEVTTSREDKVTVKTIQHGKTEKKQGRSILSENAYWEKLKESTNEKIYTITKDVIEYYRQNEAASIETETKSIVVKCYLRDTGKRMTIFYVKTDGVIETGPTQIKKTLGENGFDESIVDSYETFINGSLRKKGDTYYSKGISLVNIKKLKQEVDMLIDNI